jgi:hypothetical protein
MPYIRRAIIYEIFERHKSLMDKIIVTYKLALFCNFAETNYFISFQNLQLQKVKMQQKFKNLKHGTLQSHQHKAV